MSKITPLIELIERKVVQFSYEQESMGASFENGTVLAIYNKMSIQDTEKKGDLSIVGASVSIVREDNDFVCIQFSNGILWTIDLSDDAYSGPESMQLIILGK